MMHGLSTVRLTSAPLQQKPRWTCVSNKNQSRSYRRHLIVTFAQDGTSAEDAINNSKAPLNPQFLGVLQQSLARQGIDALTQGIKAEERVSAVEEVLQTALNQSKQSHRMLAQWRLQIEAQMVAQEKQITRMEFALNKARNDAAMLRTLKKMVYENDSD